MWFGAAVRRLAAVTGAVLSEMRDDRPAVSAGTSGSSPEGAQCVGVGGSDSRGEGGEVSPASFPMGEIRSIV